MRLTVRTCFDFLRAHQRNREQTLSEITDDETQWLEKIGNGIDPANEEGVSAARTLIHKLLETLPPQSRLIIQLLEIEEKSLKEISSLTGWSIAMIKVRAFRARAAMKKNLEKVRQSDYL
jgi:RNA polymerase sigma-70 factor (ECF subfamily)